MRTRSLLAVLAVAALAVAALGGCFSPKFKDGIACGAGGECPPGQSCGVDLKCHAPGGGSDIDAPAGTPDGPPADARVDAMPVGCQGDGDCQTPPDHCSMAGTCDLTKHTCSFPAVDCSGGSDDCNVGQCDPAIGCTKSPVREGLICGAGTTCGAYGACGGFADTCASSGTQTRTCTDFTCKTGACAGTDRSDTGACTVSTDGKVCGSSTVTACGACSGGTNNGCTANGMQTCTCTAFECMNDTCTPMGSSCTQTGCTEFAVGDECEVTASGCPKDEFRSLCCSAAHTCTVVCEACAQ